MESGCNLLMCCRILLITANIFFLLSGFILLSLGAIVLSGWSLEGGYIAPLLTELTDVNGSFSGTIFSYAFISVLLIGLLMLVLGTLAIIGVLCANRCFLILYAVVMTVLLLGQLSVVVICAQKTDQIQSELKTALKKTITDFYTGSDATSGVASSWNFVFIEYSCCGVSDYNDLSQLNAPKWDRNSSGVIPETCCKVTGSYPNYGSPTDANCVLAATDANSYHNDGCFDFVYDKINKYRVYIIAVGATIVVIELATVIAAVIVVKKRKKVQPCVQMANNNQRK